MTLPPQLECVVPAEFNCDLYQLHGLPLIGACFEECNDFSLFSGSIADGVSLCAAGMAIEEIICMLPLPFWVDGILFCSEAD